MENPAEQGAYPASHQPQPTDHKPVAYTATPNGNANNNRKKTGLFAVLAAIILMVGIGVTVFFNQQEQDIRQQAADSEKICRVGNVDVILVIDNSNSMKGTKLAEAKSSAKQFVDIVLKADPQKNRVGIAHFNKNGALNHDLTNDQAALNATIDSFKTPGDGDGGTCLECALDKVKKNESNDVAGAFDRIGNDGNVHHVIILTDGKLNRWQKSNGEIEGSLKSGDEKKAREQALAAIQRISNAHQVIFSFVHMGQAHANQAYLEGIVKDYIGNQGSYLQETSQDSLTELYTKIANKMTAKGSVSGIVFNDANGNGVKDANEEVLPGWTVKLVPAGLAQVQAKKKNNNNNNNNKNNNKGGNNNNNGNGSNDARNNRPANNNNNGGNNNNNNKGNNNNNNGKKNNKNKKNKKNNNNKNNRKHKNEAKKKTNGTTFALACAPSTITLESDKTTTIEATVTNLSNQAAPGRTVIWTSAPDDGINLAAENDGLTDDEGITSVDVDLLDPNTPYAGTITGTLDGDPSATCSVTINGGAGAIDTDNDGTPDSEDLDDDGDGINDNADVELTTTTDANGKYIFDGLCEGDFIISVVPQPDWSVTLPPGNQYKVHLIPGTPITDKDFGVKTASKSVQLDATVFMHGIGRAGDNPNPFPPQCGGPGEGVIVQSIPETRCLSNQNPLTPNRPMTIELLNTSNTVAGTGSGTLTYNASSGNFSGTASISAQLPPGSYSVKISSEKYLTKLYPGAITIAPGPNKLPVISMVVGDVYTGEDSKNQLDIRDYNAIIGCYTSPTMAAKDCGFLPNQKFLTDLNDDGIVNDFDYNLFIRELSVQFGD